MSASAWAFYNIAKKHLMDGSIDLDTDNFRISLFRSTSNADDPTLETIDQVTAEVADGFGYTLTGKPLASVTWAIGASASEMRWNAAATQWAAAGGSIADIQFAVIWKQGASAPEHKLVMWSQLETTPMTLTSGNSLTVTPSANGLFELN